MISESCATLTQTYDFIPMMFRGWNIWFKICVFADISSLYWKWQLQKDQFFSQASGTASWTDGISESRWAEEHSFFSTERDLFENRELPDWIPEKESDITSGTENMEGI